LSTTERQLAQEEAEGLARKLTEMSAAMMVVARHLGHKTKLNQETARIKLDEVRLGLDRISAGCDRIGPVVAGMLDEGTGG
jgi:hypothetical protein